MVDQDTDSTRPVAVEGLGKWVAKLGSLMRTKPGKAAVAPDLWLEPYGEKYLLNIYV